MPKPKGKGAGRSRRAARGKGVTKERRPKAKGAKEVPRKGKVLAPKKETRVKAKPVTKAAVPPAKPVVPKAVPTVEKRKEGVMAKELTPEQFLATVLVPEHTRDTGHMCWDCKHFKPVLKGSKFPPGDTIGWCTMIHWPFYWCITDFNVVKKCYAFEKGIYTPYQPERFR